ncbi:MAG: adenosylcobinamide amidohydrolase [Thermoplasmatales archaeon]|nr:adenosylcobinamide amidohydrolase [Thermoplasmatales archaeon]
MNVAGTKPYELEIVADGDVSHAIIRLKDRMEYLSNTVLNGGLGKTGTVLMMQVPKDYACADAPAAIAALAKSLGLPRDTVGFMTAAEIGYVLTEERGKFDGTVSHAVVTAGLSNHVVAGDELTDWEERRAVSLERSRALGRPGTINVAAFLPKPLNLRGMVNAMIPITEAKTRAMAFMGYAETGTTTDAVALFSPTGRDREDYVSTGSPTGISIARAVRRGVAASLVKRGDFPVGMSKQDIERIRKLEL